MYITDAGGTVAVKIDTTKIHTFSLHCKDVYGGDIVLYLTTLRKADGITISVCHLAEEK